MENKKPFLERYKEWRENAHKWADEHPVLGFPIKHTFALLFAVFLIVTIVCGIANVSANHKKYDHDDVSLVPQRANVIRSETLIFSPNPQYVKFSYLLSNNELGGDVTFEDDYGVYFYDCCFGNSLAVGTLLNAIPNNLSMNIDLRWAWNVQVSHTAFMFVGDYGNFQLKYSYGGNSYNATISSGFPFFVFTDYVYDLNGFSIEFSNYQSQSVDYIVAVPESFALNTINNYYGNIDSIREQLEAEKIAFGQSEYNRGKEDGFQLGNSHDMTLTTLFWNVIDEPFAIIYRLLNFDVLGVNVFAFVMGLVTLGLIGFIIKLVV